MHIHEGTESIRMRFSRFVCVDGGKDAYKINNFLIMNEVWWLWMRMRTWGNIGYIIWFVFKAWCIQFCVHFSHLPIMFLKKQLSKTTAFIYLLGERSTDVRKKIFKKSSSVLSVFCCLVHCRFYIVGRFIFIINSVYKS